MATRRQFEDQALEARCLTHVTQQTNRKDIPVVLPDSFYVRQLKIRNKLLKFRYDYYDKIDVDKALKIDMGNIEPRIRQAINSFLPLIINDSQAFDSFKSFVIGYNKQVIEERGLSFDGQIVNAIAEYISEGKMMITGKDIATKLENNGLKATDRTVGRHLKQLGLKTEQKRDNDTVKKIVPINQKLLDICKRYVFDEAVFCIVVSKVSTLLVDPHIDTQPQQQTLNSDSVKRYTSTYTNDTNDTTIQKNDTLYMKIKELGKDNKETLYQEFGETKIQELLKNGDLFESPKGTLRVLE